jgi:DNA-directed RNA polymerase subunit F
LKNQGSLSLKDYDFIYESGFYQTLKEIAALSYLMKNRKNRKRKALNEMSSFLMMSQRKAENFYNSFHKNNPEKAPRIYDNIKNHDGWCYIAGKVNQLVPTLKF